MTRSEFNQLRTFSNQPCPDCGSTVIDWDRLCNCPDDKHIMEQHHICFRIKLKTVYNTVRFKKNSNTEWTCLDRLGGHPLAIVILRENIHVLQIRGPVTITLKQLIDITYFLKQVNK